MHLLALFKFNRQITKSYVVHSMLMELYSLLAAQTLLQEYVFLLSTAGLCASDFTRKSWIAFSHLKFSFQVWSACKSGSEEHDQPNHEMDVLSGHENDVNYVQFSGCVVSRSFSIDSSHTTKEENNLKLRYSGSVFFFCVYGVVILHFINLLLYMFLVISVVHLFFNLTSWPPTGGYCWLQQF
jgi:hypothetical protein